MKRLYVFVFGSNLAGRHGKGAALDAVHGWGAIRANGVGMQGAGPYGTSYAIPTKDRNLRVLPLPVIGAHIAEFLDVARYWQDRTFLVTRIGCGYAGFTDVEIAPLFAGAPEVCQFDPAWARWGLKTWTKSPNEIAAEMRSSQRSLF